MLATLIKEPFDHKDWIFEVKWDGFRALAFTSKRGPKQDPKRDKVELRSRNNLLWNDKFPAIVQSLEKIKSDLILDGELVVLDSRGKSSFQLMQNYQMEGKGRLYYYVFDLLYKDGQDLRRWPLIERKALLKKTLQALALPHIRFSRHIAKKGAAFFKAASKAHLEGIIGKKGSSPYVPKRSRDWVKIKIGLRQEFVIGGFTAPRGSRKKFGALLIGVYDKLGKLQYVGSVGGGFDAKRLEETHAKLKSLVTAKSPFALEPRAKESITWVKPHLVCEASFAEWTKEGKLRQPIFLGLRTDKSPKAVKREKPRLTL